MFAKPYKLKSTNTLKNSEKKHLAQWIEEEFPAATEETVKQLVPVKSNTSCLKLVLHSGDIVGVYVVDGVPTMLEVGGRLVPTVCALWAAPDLLPTLTIHSLVHKKVANGAPLYVPGVVLTPEAVAEFSAGALVAARTDDNAAAVLVGRAAMSSADLMFRDSGVCLEPLHVSGDQLCRDARFGRLERPARPASAAPAPRTPAPAHHPAPAPAAPAPRTPAPAHHPVPAPAPAQSDALAAAVKQLSITKPPVKAKEEWPSLGRPGPGPQQPTPAHAGPAEPADRSGLGGPGPGAAPAWCRAPEAAPRPALIAESPPPRPREPQPRGDEPAPLEDSIDDEAGEGGEEDVPTDMDQLLRWCLLTFLRLEGRSVELPLKTSLLYRNHLIPLCPAERTLDVKKSSYKKVGKFLEAMQQEGLVELRELEYGVDAVVRVQAEHPALRAHRLPAELRARCRLALSEVARRGGDAAPEYVPPRLRDVYCVTAAVAGLLAAHRKGAAMSAAEVRAAVTQYVQERGLTSQQPKGVVQLDAALAALTARRPGEGMKWEDLMNAVHNKMTPSTELRLGDGSVRLARGRLEPVRMQVASRSGNKKVTLVSNLESYGFSLPELAAVSQRGVAASCGVTRASGAKADQLMLQGDQTHFVAKLLIEKYGLPKKYVEGADKALKKKK